MYAPLVLRAYSNMWSINKSIGDINQEYHSESKIHNTGTEEVIFMILKKKKKHYIVKLEST